MTDDTIKPVYFVMMSGASVSREQKKSQYAKIQGHLAKAGHRKRKKAQNRTPWLISDVEETTLSSLVRSESNAPWSSPVLAAWRPFDQSSRTSEAESDTEHDELIIEWNLNVEALTNYGYSQTIRVAHWRAQNHQFAELAFVRRASSDPFYSCFAGLDPVTIFEAIETYWNILIPTHTALAHLFQYENRWGGCLTSSITQPMYWYCMTSLLIVARSSLAGPEVKASPQVLQYIGLTLEALREKLNQPGHHLDRFTILITAYLIEISYRLCEYSMCQVFRRHLRRMVDDAGGLHMIHPPGTTVGLVKDYDTYWVFEEGEFLFPEVFPKSELHYIDDIIPGEAQILLTQLPLGFYELFRNSKISVEISRHIARAIQVSDLSELMRTTALYTDAPLTKDMFAACPALHTIKDTTGPLELEAAISLAMVLYYCRAIMPSHTIFSKFHAIRKRLTIGLREPCSRISQAERECWIWLWMIAIESWQSATEILHSEGEKLLARLFFQQKATTGCACPRHLEIIASRFLWNDNLNRCFKSKWDSTERKGLSDLWVPRKGYLCCEAT